MKYAYISTIDPGYMFAMNANMNANQYYGTNADVHLLYSSNMDNDSVEVEYMKKCESAFPFKVKWIKLNDFGTSFHNAKYNYAKSLKDEYDAVCLIDADLFICADTKKYFEKVANENVLISATYLYSSFKQEDMLFENPELLVDRNQAYLADFPVFINPKFGEELFDCWYKNTIETYVDVSKEIFHPLVAFNRCVCKTLSPEQIISLDGQIWVCDKDFWSADYIRKDDIMVKGTGERVCAMHNKWWKLGRANGEWLAHRHIKEDNIEMIKRLDRGERNFNAIRDFMAWFNEMTPETKRNNYFKEKIDRKEYLKKSGYLN